MAFLICIDQMIMSGRWLVERISGGKTICSWSKSTSNFQSEAPCNWDLIGYFYFLNLLWLLSPALTKEIWGAIIIFVAFQEFTCDCNASWMCRRTESCLQVYLFVWRATGQLESIWCNVHLLLEHRRQRLEFDIPQSLRRVGVFIQLMEALRTNFIIR